MRLLLIAGLTTSAAAQTVPPLRLVREFSLDASTGVSFGTIGGMDIGSDGSIALVDIANGVIYRFTAQGKLRDSLGHRGQGPGEFLAAAGIAIGPAGEVALADIRTRRITVWNPDGSLRGASQVNGMPIDLLWRGPSPILGTMTFAPGAGAAASFGSVTLGAQAIPGTPIAAFPDPTKEDFATAVTCGMCRRTLTAEGRLIGAAPDTIYRISELGPDGTALRTWQRTGGSPGGYSLPTPGAGPGIRSAGAAPRPGQQRGLHQSGARCLCPGRQVPRHRHSAGASHRHGRAGQPYRRPLRNSRWGAHRARVPH